MGLSGKEIGIIKDHTGESYSVLGRRNTLKVGNAAPAFELRTITPETGEIIPILSADLFKDRIVLLHTTFGAFDKISKETTLALQEFRKRAVFTTRTPTTVLYNSIPNEQLAVVTVTLDLLTAQAHWKEKLMLGPEVAHTIASVSHSLDNFALDWRVLRRDPMRGLQEGIHVIDNGIIAGIWLQSDLTQPISYQPAMEQAIELATSLALRLDGTDTADRIARELFPNIANPVQGS